MNTKRALKTVSLTLAVCAALVPRLLGFSTATITTDQKHYSVGAVMTVSGTGFSPQVTITLTVVRPDQLTDVVPGVTTDTTGAFTAAYTPPLEPGRYKFTATDGANTATTASTEADAIGFSKAVYRKADTTYAGGAGTWTTGDAGSNFLENQFAFYQYQPTGITTDIPDFDVQYNYHQASSQAIFVDAFANFRACVTAYTSNGKIVLPNLCASTDSSGLLLDGVPFPTSVTHWIDAHTAISNVNHSISADGSTCLAAPDPVDTVTNDIHCFHVTGASLKALLVANNAAAFNVAGADNYSVTLYYAAHLAATAVWKPFSGTIGHEALLGCFGNGNYVVHTAGANFLGEGAEFVPAPGPAVAGVPVGTFGTEVYDTDADPCDTPTAGDDWTTKAFFGIGSATGSSRHFTLANPQIGGVSVGSQGAITLPIPSVAAPTGSITIVKVTNPANSGPVPANTFAFSGDLGNFTLDTNSGDATNPNSFTATGLPGGLDYSVSELEPAGWVPSGIVTCVNNTGTSTFGTPTGTSVTISLAATAGAAVTCTFHNAQPDANITITPLTKVNEVGSAHVFTITFTAIPNGATPVSFTSITPSFVGTPPGTQSTTCGAPNIVGNVATCTLTINSSTPGTFTAHAVGVVSIAGTPFTRATGDANAGDSADGVKHYVDANVSITATATNEVGVAHIFNITVNALPDDTGTPTFTSITPSVTPTPSSQSTTCGAPTIVVNQATCTFTINSTAAGVFTANATAVVTMGGVAVTRVTNDGKTGDVGPAVKTYISASTTLTLKSSTPANGSNAAVGNTATIVVTETNTGSGTLTGVAVTPGGKCANFTGGATTLAAGASTDFTCTFTITAGANAWTADGVGTDSLGNPAPSTGEHQAGSLTGLTTATTLVLKSSTPANGSNAAVGATATIVVTETNTGTASLTGVAVTPGGKCSAFTGGATTLAAGAATDFTCTFTVTAGANAWTALGIGTDQFGNPAPATNESANGSLTGLAPATTLTTKSVTPVGSVEVGTLVTVVVTETNTGNSALTGVSVSGGGVCASFTGGATTLAIGASADFTCTFTAALGANAWFGDGHGTDSLGNPVPSTGEHTSGSTTGLTSYLIINKIAEGASGTFGFNVAGPTPSTPSVSATTGGPTTFTGTTGPVQVHTGAYVIDETTVPSAQWTRIGATCTVSPSAATIGALTGGANFEWGFTMPLGVTVTCTFDNAFVPSATTRTQGFWATHTCLSNAVWNGTANPCGTTNATKGPVPPSLATICVVPITALAVPGENQLMGGFWANIANLSTAKGKTGARTDADKARMQMLQQYLAAVLNFLEFGSVPDTFGTTLSGALAVYCNPASTAAQIITVAGELDAFNSSGDAGLFNPGINATPQESKIEADIDFWDDPTNHTTDFK